MRETGAGRTIRLPFQFPDERREHLANLFGELKIVGQIGPPKERDVADEEQLILQLAERTVRDAHVPQVIASHEKAVAFGDVRRGGCRATPDLPYQVLRLVGR
jgi:hypothetical protein